MTEVLKISAVDLGTNTLKATHATRIDGDVLLDMLHASDTVRLGAGIEATGRIEQQRIDACIRFLHQQELIGLEYGSTAFIGVATEALRIAANGADLLDRIHRETRWQIKIISGDREAELTYFGLRDQVPANVNCAIVDIGGGSTEVVVIEDGECVLNTSLPIGSGRLADRFFATDPPGADAEHAAIDAAYTLIASTLESGINADFAMLAGGSGLFMHQLIEQLVSTTPFDLPALISLAERLATTPAADTISRIEIPLARAQLLPASVAVGVAIMKQLNIKQAIGVPSGIRMGLIREYVSQN